MTTTTTTTKREIANLTPSSRRRERGSHPVTPGIDPIRVAIAFLTQTPFKARDVRAMEDFPGLLPEEIELLKLLTLLTNGTKVEINETGTNVHLKPGTITGGRLAFDEISSTTRLLYLLYPVALLAPFCKTPLDLTLTGGVTDDGEFNVDYFTTVTIPLLEHFGVTGSQLEVKKRGMSPGGGGSIRFTSLPVRKHLTIPNRLDAHTKLYRVRGTAYSLRISPQISNRVALAVRTRLERVADDVYLATDARGTRGGGVGSATPGFGCSVTFETVIEEEIRTLHNPPIVSSLGVFVQCEVENDDDDDEVGGGSKRLRRGEDASSSSAVSPARRAGEVETAEKMAKRLFMKVIREMERGGNVDTFHQRLVVVLMACCPQDVVRVRIGSELDPRCVQTLRDLKECLNVVFKIVKCEEEKGGGIMLSCVGSGISNVARKVT